ncbi:MAG: GNAT family N-acetyltransferase [Cellulomonadaceae bacterium]|nr:GNAT family N-acetyltransferase [Cellulomonadaceae bacterium]
MRHAGRVVQIRRADEDDWALVQQVRLRSLREDGDVFGSSLAREEMFKESHWRMRLRSSPTWLAVTDGGATVGCVSMILEPGSPADDRHVVALWVAPEVRRRGVGWTLLDTVRRAAVHDEARTVSLWLEDSNHGAVDLAVRAGFTRTSERHALTRDPSRVEERYVLTLA